VCFSKSVSAACIYKTQYQILGCYKEWIHIRHILT
jgi:hypothetical protein